MAKKKAKRRYTRRTKRSRRRKTPRVPIEVVIAGASIPFTPPKSGWASPWAHIQQGNMEEALKHLSTGFGFEPDQPLNVVGLINPFDLETARYGKILLWSGVAGMIRHKLSGKYTDALFRKLPLVGRFIK